MTRLQLSKDAQFFYDHAGYSYRPPMSPKEGRVLTALALRDAEIALGNSEFCEVIWEDDGVPWDGDTPWGGPVFVALLVRWDERSIRYDVLGSLGGIAMYSTSDPYARVVAAELASSHLAEIIKPGPYGG